MGFERSVGRKSQFDKEKLAKTGSRRAALERERRLADLRATSGRNDLLPPLAITQVALADLQPAARRVRKDNPELIEALVVSISRFGFIGALLVSGSSIIDGHARYSAAQVLGLPTVPVIDCQHLDAAEVRLLAIAVNRLGEQGDWDLDALRLEFIDLIELDEDMAITGFSSAEQDIILLDPHAPDPKADEVPDPYPSPVSLHGDVWLLGDDHRVLCGNALEEANYGTLLKGELAHAALSDLPYNVRIKGNVSGLGKKVHKDFVMASGVSIGVQTGPPIGAQKGPPFTMAQG